MAVGELVGAAGHLNALESEGIGHAPPLVGDQGLEVGVADLFLHLGNFFEALERGGELVALERVAQLFHALLKRVTPAELAQHQGRAAQPDALRLHDLVGRLVLHHAVLVDAGGVTERVLADDGLVRLDGEASVLADQPA